MSPPSRSRRRGSRSRWFGTVAVAALLVVLAFGTGVPGAAFDVATVDRSGQADVVGNPSGAAELNVTSQLEAGTSGQCLVTITNHLGTDVTVTVSLREDSRDLGTLTLANDVQSGDSIQFSLAQGNTRTVNMDVASGTAGNTTYFHVNASASGFQTNLPDRSAPIESSATTTCE